MYDVPNFYLVANPINRYSIGDRTPGIVYADDGSLTITISHDRPDRPNRRGELAPRPRRCLPPRPAHVRARTRGPQPDLHRPAHRPLLIPPTQTLITHE